jgi:hypothetical protein
MIATREMTKKESNNSDLENKLDVKKEKKKI